MAADETSGVMHTLGDAKVEHLRKVRNDSVLTQKDVGWLKRWTKRTVGTARPN
jgi:hypothetical protein